MIAGIIEGTASVVYLKDGSIGGTGSVAYLNDVWKSADGNDWDQVAAGSTATAADRFIPRHSHGSAVLGNNIYVVSGERPLKHGTPPVNVAGPSANIWKSVDGGTRWTKLTLRIATGSGSSIGRQSFGLEVLQNALYLMGGAGIARSGPEVWESSENPTPAPGVVTWTRVTRAAAARKFTGRQEHSSAVLGGALYVLGGTDGTTVRNDIWKSTDKGQNWTKVGENAQALERTRHTSVVLDNAIYVIGGRKSSALQNDVWKCTDGAAAGVSCVNVHKNP